MSAGESWRKHWPHYLIEAALPGMFMVSACAFCALLEHPHSPARHAIASPIVRRLLMGITMGLTAVGIVYSPWGRQSGAHMNPSVTLTFLRLQKIGPWDAAFYIAAQFLGAWIGVILTFALLGAPLADPAVQFVVTVPGERGASVALAAEFVMSFAMMAIVLLFSSSDRLARYTGVAVGIALIVFVTIGAPLSGMSINPARTFGSSTVSGVWTAFWVYVIAPPAGMLAAAEVYVRARRRRAAMASDGGHV